MDLSPWPVLLLGVLLKAFVISGDTNGQDSAGLTAIAASWNTKPSNWVGIDPCGDKWTGIMCTVDRVTSISLNSNKFTGPIPASLGSLSELYWLDLGGNKLTGRLPTFNGTNPGLDNLTNTLHFHFGVNQLSGTIPFQIFHSNMTLIHLLLDNNNFSGSFPPTLGLITGLEVLYLENLSIGGQLPQALFSLPVLQTVRLRGNHFNGTLSIGSDFSSQLELIDLQDNKIEEYAVGGSTYKQKLILVGNPICKPENNQPYCTTTGQANTEMPPYATAKNCSSLPPVCLPEQMLSPNCICSVPYKGIIFFRSPSFSDLSNSSYFIQIEQQMRSIFLANSIPLDSISVHDPYFNAHNNLQMNLELFPSGKTKFTEQDISDIGFMLSSQSYKPPKGYGPYYFIGQEYTFANAVVSKPKMAHRIPLIVGDSVGGVVLIAVGVTLVIIIARRKRRPAQTEGSQPFGYSLGHEEHQQQCPQLHGARMFMFGELKKITSNFSEANVIGNGSYGKVYRGTLPGGQLVAVKRSQQGSLQGSLEFRTEVELLSRVHHKNVVTLVGFCVDQAEQMLVYEYVPNGTLRESLAGKSGVRLDWRRRLRVLLGAAKGVAYLHELADPPVVHRDMKSSNVLLDERLNAKVSDFGLSKPMGVDGRGQVTTRVKGTMVGPPLHTLHNTNSTRVDDSVLLQGYLDPEYYMTQRLSEKSDVYSFGVLMLEVITARKPLEHGRYVVREVKTAADRGKDLCGLHELMDPALAASPSAPAGLEQYVDLALRCVEEAGAVTPLVLLYLFKNKIMQHAGFSCIVKCFKYPAST
ncbi:putative leucine-rich repeat receptor-like protein kinase [Dichanthelium oligosanthes]|uniref:non-specific serine/threonine protein kinase n=1 Tax=Dichanthelium oligosanthes TaxID=888268 RepID=A0A1E5W171_9POAL|nr:putative leucine-rich repeat receptor-like protein kinase [Dichanthelium oligosanthes]